MEVNEWWIIGYVEVMAYFKALLQYLPGSTEENHKTYFLIVKHLKLLVLKSSEIIQYGSIWWNLCQRSGI
jgi:hypothetical protein